MTFLEKLKEKSSCPVYELAAGSELVGQFIYDYCSCTLVDNRGRIRINRYIPISKKIGALAHEIGHARCWNRQCFCFEKNNQKRILQEVHATLYVLHILLRNHRKNAIKELLNNLLSKNIRARDIVKKRRIYKRCQEFVKER